MGTSVQRQNERKSNGNEALLENFPIFRTGTQLTNAIHTQNIPLWGDLISQHNILSEYSTPHRQVCWAAESSLPIYLPIGESPT